MSTTRCAFCGRTAPQGEKWIGLLGVFVCVVTCAWKFCARATNGVHRKGEDGACLDCGKPAVVPK